MTSNVAAFEVKNKPEGKFRGGFLQLRRGLWDHLRDGRMTRLEVLAFIYICSQADTRSGVWSGSAGALSGEIGFEPRTARDVLERMEESGYIRRFALPGSHLCYPILVHKYLITTGEHNGEQLDALSSTFVNGCLKLAFFPREEDVKVHGEEDVKDNAALKRSKKREERKEKHKRGDAAKAAAAPPPCEMESYLGTLPPEIRKHALNLKTWLIDQFIELGRLPNLLMEKESFIKHCDAEALLDYRQICELFRGVVKWVRWLLPAPRVIDPIGPVDEARLKELKASDPECLDAYMVGNIAVMEYANGIEEIHPGEPEPFWFAYDDPKFAERVRLEEPALVCAMPAVGASIDNSSGIPATHTQEGVRT